MTELFWYENISGCVSGNWSWLINIKYLSIEISIISDVTVGSILGLAVAYLVYYMYYPPLHRHNSNLPYVSISPVDTQVSSRDYPISSAEVLHLASPSTQAAHMEQSMKLVW